VSQPASTHIPYLLVSIRDQIRGKNVKLISFFRDASVTVMLRMKVTKHMNKALKGYRSIHFSMISIILFSLLVRFGMSEAFM